ncbi:MAG: alpha/beta fold hydrolase [Planctomycetota bacterium]
MRLTLLVALVFLVCGLLMWGCQRKLIYPGAWMANGTATALPEGAERWERPVGGGVVEAIMLPGEGATVESPGPALILMHGNSEVIDQWAHIMSGYTSAGFTVLLPEYRGYAPSAGRPSQPVILEDLVAFRQRLVDLETVDPERVVYIGRSLGGGFAAQLAARRPPAALVLSATFSSFADAAGEVTRLPRWMVRDRLEVSSVLRDYPGPVLVLHGEDDPLLGVHHAKANAEAAATSHLIVYPDTGHDNLPQNLGREDDILGFLTDHGVLTPSGE